MQPESRETKWALLIIALNFLIKAVVASVLELGNDEVYYWTYALYPDLSHFDHPPMVGWLIQATTLNLLLTNEFFIRLGSLLLSSVGIWLTYKIGLKVGTAKTGIIAALLYCASPYFNIISGLMIMPDTPQVPLLIGSTYILINTVTSKSPSIKEDVKLLLAGLLIGLAFLAKYHSLITWFGVLLYIAIYNRKWLSRPSLYAAGIITLIAMLPVLIWNIQNDFISFAFHGDRVTTNGLRLNPVAFIQFNAGQILYQNPIVFIAIVWAVYHILMYRGLLDDKAKLLLLISLPYIIVFTSISIFRVSLPHWSGPGFIGLIIVTAKILSTEKIKPKKLRATLVLANLIVLLALLLGPVLVNRGMPLAKGKSTYNDVTLDMYGWRKFAPEFDSLLVSKGVDLKTDEVAIVCSKWFPAAHVDYYYAYPRGIDLYALGTIEQIHKYHWINQYRRSICNHSRFFYITTSQNFQAPDYLKLHHFTEAKGSDTIQVFRHGRLAKTFYITELTGCREH